MNIIIGCICVGVVLLVIYKMFNSEDMNENIESNADLIDLSEKIFKYSLKRMGVVNSGLFFGVRKDMEKLYINPIMDFSMVLLCLLESEVFVDKYSKSQREKLVEFVIKKYQDKVGDNGLNVKSVINVLQLDMQNSDLSVRDSYFKIIENLMNESGIDFNEEYLESIINIQIFNILLGLQRILTLENIDDSYYNSFSGDSVDETLTLHLNDRLIKVFKRNIFEKTKIETLLLGVFEVVSLLHSRSMLKTSSEDRFILIDLLLNSMVLEKLDFKNEKEKHELLDLSYVIFDKVNKDEFTEGYFDFYLSGIKYLSELSLSTTGEFELTEPDMEFIQQRNEYLLKDFETTGV